MALRLLLLVAKQNHSNEEGPTKVVTVSVYQRIQSCKQQEKSKSQTAKDLKLSRGTVRKFWNMSREAYDRFCVEASRRKQRFDPFCDEIIEVLSLNAADGQQVYTASLYDLLEERHGKLPGTQRTLANYVRMLEETGQVEVKQAQRVRRPQEESNPGEQCQVDFGELRISSGEKVYIFAAVLAMSRARYVRVQDYPLRTRDVITYILESFTYFGGRPSLLVIDQDKLMTVSENNGEVIHTKEFQHFIDEQDLRVFLCRKADPESKGKVENTVKFVKTSFFSARRFSAVDEIHEPLQRWLGRRANGKLCQATGRVPWVVLEQVEQVHLRPLRASIYDWSTDGFRDTRRVDAKAMISFGGNRYSVPQEYAGATVGIVISQEHLSIRDAHTGEEIAMHRVPLEKSQTIVLPEHRVAPGQQAEQEYAELASLLPGEAWAQYLQGNLQHFRRHWKKQAAGLRRLVSRAENLEALEAAVSFCIEADSYGMGDLTHAYEHLDEAAKSSLTPLLENARPIMAARRAPDSQVSKRSVRYYLSVVSLLTGGAL